MTTTDESVLKELKIKTLEKFQSEILSICKEKRINQLDAALIYAELHNVELETVAELIKQSPKLKSAIQAVGENLYLLKSTGAKLPF